MTKTKGLLLCTTLYILLCMHLSVNAQLTLTGTVMDEEGNPLIGATVMERGTENGTVTDMDGSFTFGSDRDTLSIAVSYIGYNPVIMELITVETPLSITLDQDGIYTGGCGVVILAPETKVVQNYTQLNTQQLTLNPSANISEALNATPGVVMQSGTYGTNRLTMRGIGSRNQFGTAKILGYWNGIPLTNTRGELSIDDINLKSISHHQSQWDEESPQGQIGSRDSL